MPPKLYMILESPPARAVIFCAKSLDVELDLIEVNVFEDEQFKPEFLKLNPQHTVPVLDDDGFIVYDSHAIMPYIVSKYSKGNSLYPEDIKKRAIIDNRLYFDCATLFPAHLNFAYGVVKGNTKTVTDELLKPQLDAFNVLEIFLENARYTAGDDLTIADFSIWTTISNISTYLSVDDVKYPNISRWLKLMDQLPFSTMNREGVDRVRTMIQSKLTSE